MSNCPLCNLEPAPSATDPNTTALATRDGNRPTGLGRRAWRSVQWLFPATLLVLTPKCPMCVIGYVALVTGFGISVSTARWIQILMPVVCVSALAYLAVRYWRNRWSRRTKARWAMPSLRNPLLRQDSEPRHV